MLAHPHTRNDNTSTWLLSLATMPDIVQWLQVLVTPQTQKALQLLS